MFYLAICIIALLCNRRVEIDLNSFGLFLLRRSKVKTEKIPFEATADFAYIKLFAIKISAFCDK